jgi:hypothetical protein
MYMTMHHGHKRSDRCDLLVVIHKLNASTELIDVCGSSSPDRSFSTTFNMKITEYSIASIHISTRADMDILHGSTRTDMQSVADDLGNTIFDECSKLIIVRDGSVNCDVTNSIIGSDMDITVSFFG